MYRIKYIFGLTVADAAIKDMMDQLRAPCPAIKDALTVTMTMDTPEIPDEEMSDKLIEIAKKEYAKLDLNGFVVVGVEYKGIADVHKI